MFRTVKLSGMDFRDSLTSRWFYLCVRYGESDMTQSLILRRPFDFRIKKDGQSLDNLVIIMLLMKTGFVSSMKIGMKTIFAFGLKNKNEKVKFIYSEKATNFCEISTVDLSYVVTVKSTVEISQSFVAFSEYMNFTYSFKDESLLVLIRQYQFLFASLYR